MTFHHLIIKCIGIMLAIFVMRAAPCEALLDYPGLDSAIEQSDDIIVGRRVRFEPEKMQRSSGPVITAIPDGYNGFQIENIAVEKVIKGSIKRGEVTSVSVAGVEYLGHIPLEWPRSAAIFSIPEGEEAILFLKKASGSFTPYATFAWFGSTLHVNHYKLKLLKPEDSARQSILKVVQGVPEGSVDKYISIMGIKP